MKPYVSYLTIVGVIALVFAGGVGFYIYWQWNKLHPDYCEMCPDSSWEAHELVKLFEENEDRGNDELGGTLIEVSGIVGQVDSSFFLIEPGVVVTWEPGREGDVSKGSRVSVQGQLAGFDDLLLEVKLQHACIRSGGCN